MRSGFGLQQWALRPRISFLQGPPANTKLLHDISWSFDKIAGARMQTGDFPGALDAAFASLAIRRKLSAADPKNLIWRRDTAAALHLIGEVKAKAGDFPMARMFFLAAAEARLALKKDAPGDAGFAAAFEASMARALEALAKSLEAKASLRGAGLSRGCGRGGSERRRQGGRTSARTRGVLGRDPCRFARWSR